MDISFFMKTHVPYMDAIPRESCLDIQVTLNTCGKQVFKFISQKQM